MKKVFVGLLTAASLASADFIGVSAGAGMWQENIDGYVKSGNSINYLSKEDNDPNTGNLKLSNEIKPYVWVKVIHPIPILPNIKAEYRQYHSVGRDGTVVGETDFYGAKINAAGTADTDLTINSYDITAFYEMKLFFDVEAGFGVNVLDGKTDILVNNSDRYISNWTVPVPYLYGRVETPTLWGISVEAQAKYLEVSTAFYHDYQAGIKYHLPTPVVDVYFSTGYKQQEIYGKDGDDETDIKFSGAYAEVGAKW